jgi:hypothetical protein
MTNANLRRSRDDLDGSIGEGAFIAGQWKTENLMRVDANEDTVSFCAQSDTPKGPTRVFEWRVVPKTSASRIDAAFGYFPLVIQTEGVCLFGCIEYVANLCGEIDEAKRFGNELHAFVQPAVMDDGIASISSGEQDF